VWVVSIITYYYLYRNYKSSVHLNIRYAKKAPVQARTVLVSELPRSIQTNEDLAKYFGDMYGNNNIYTTVMAPIVKKLRKAQEKRVPVLQQWRYAKAAEREKGKRELMK